MYESNTEVQVGEVAANQTQAEEETDGDNGSQVYPARHLDGLSAIEERGIARKNLCHDRRERQVVGGEDDGVFCLGLSILFLFPFPSSH